MNITHASSLGVAGVLALAAAPAMSQVTAGSNEIHLYVGEMFGDDLTERTVNGRTPELDDDITYGLRYGYNFSEAWGIDISGAWTPTSVTGLTGSDVDLDLTTFDIDAIWHFAPGAPVAWYLVFGAGYAMADLDQPIVGIVNGQLAAIDDDDGFTANAGVGLKWFATEAFLVRADARYRYIDKLVDQFDDSLATYEVSLGIGWKF